MTRFFPALLVLPVLALLPPVVRAESELYGGVGLGYSTFSSDATFGGEPISFEAAGRATRQFLGLRYGDYLGLEAGYLNFGSVKDQIVLEAGQPSLNDGIKTRGYDLSLVGRYPLDEELAVFGKLGVIRWDSEETIGSLPLPNKLDGDDLIWGLGLDFRGAGRIHLRVEAEFVDIAFANSWWVLSTSVMYGIPFAR